MKKHSWSVFRKMLKFSSICTILILLVPTERSFAEEIATQNSTELLTGNDEVSNIKAYASYDEVNDEIHLNLTWEYPTDTSSPKYYIKQDTLVEDDDEYCNRGETEQMRPIPSKSTSIILNRQHFPGCTYKVEIGEIDVSSRIAPYIIYTVPDCVDNKCICHFQDPFPVQPDITVKQISMEVIRISWKIPEITTMANISNIFFKVSQTGKNKPIGLVEHNVTSTISYEDVTVSRMTPGTIYYVHGWYADALSCKSETAILAFHAIDVISAINVAESQIAYKVMISLMFIIMFVCVLWLMWKRKCNCIRRLRSAPSSHLKRIDKADTNGSRSNLSIPMQYNNIYVNEDASETDDEYEVRYTQLQFGPQIGKGAFGLVFRARLPPHIIVAVKTLKRTLSYTILSRLGLLANAVTRYIDVDLDVHCWTDFIKLLPIEHASNEEREDFRLEIAMLKQIGRHPNIVTLLGCCTKSQPNCMVMEYIPCGDLLRYLHALRSYYDRSRSYSNHSNKQARNIVSNDLLIAPPSIPFNRLPSIRKTIYTELSSTGALECVLEPHELQSFAVQIARGMRHLEHKGIVHRDLAARNVLIDENKTLKISDFGLSRRGVYVNSKQKKVPLRWMSVEAIRDNLYTSKSDVWAYGIVLWEIGTLGGFPYPTVNDADILGYLLSGKRLEKPENCTTELYAMMLRSWSSVQSERPSFTELLGELESISSKRRVYVDFSQLNPVYMLPPKSQLSINDSVISADTKTLEKDI